MAPMQQFRSQLNGFHRQDVVSYIELMNNQHNAQLQQLQNELQLARENQADPDLQAQLDAALARCAELEAQVAQLQETGGCSEQELEAYRRAERAERQAQQRAEQLMAQAHGIVAEVSAHADENAQQIGQMAEQVAAQLAVLQQVVMSSKATFMDAAVAMCAIRPQE